MVEMFSEISDFAAHARDFVDFPFVPDMASPQKADIEGRYLGVLEPSAHEIITAADAKRTDSGANRLNSAAHLLSKRIGNTFIRIKKQDPFMTKDLEVEGGVAVRRIV